MTDIVADNELFDKFNQDWHVNRYGTIWWV